MDPQDPENGEEGVQKTGNQDGKFSGVVAEDILDVNLSDPNKPKVRVLTRLNVSKYTSSYTRTKLLSNVEPK